MLKPVTADSQFFVRRAGIERGLQFFPRERLSVFFGEKAQTTVAKTGFENGIVAVQPHIVVNPDMIGLSRRHGGIQIPYIGADGGVVGAERPLAKFSVHILHPLIIAAERMGQVLLMMPDGRQHVDTGGEAEVMRLRDTFFQDDGAFANDLNRQRRMGFAGKKGYFVRQFPMLLKKTHQVLETIIPQPPANADAEREKRAIR